MSDKNKSDERSIVLTVGSKYRVRSLESKEKPLITIGIFKGYTAIGSDEGICIEMSSEHKSEKLVGKLRVIPTHMISSIDIISAVKSDKKEKKPEIHQYFG